MARRTIPPEEKELVKARLAAGASTREAVKGLPMHDTTALEIARSNSSEIQQLKQLYIQKVRDEGADEAFRAKQWVDMAKHPDWQARKEALKYIDQLIGVGADDEEKGNTSITFNLISFNGNNDTPQIPT